MTQKMSPARRRSSTLSQLRAAGAAGALICAGAVLFAVVATPSGPTAFEERPPLRAFDESAATADTDASRENDTHSAAGPLQPLAGGGGAPSGDNGRPSRAAPANGGMNLMGLIFLRQANALNGR